jgi:hypothetical protein
MPNISTIIGVPQIFLSVDSAVGVPAVSSLTFTASGVTPDDLLINDTQSALSTSDTYQVIVGLVGRDPKGGYTVGYCSPSSGNLTITAGQVIKVSVLNANWPANFNYATAAVIFLKTNAGNFQLCQFSYIDPSDDFITFIPTKPLRAAPSFTSALLQSTTSDPILGSRSGLGVTYLEITPTTGTFTFRNPVSNVTVSPNNAGDFQIATNRSVGVEFQSLSNDLKAFVQSAAGNYVSYTTGGSTYKEARRALNTAQAILRGNKPIQVFMPPDPTGAQEVRLLVGQLTVNQTELTEAWSKTATTPVTFRFDAASLDRLINNMHTEISYLKTT